MIKTISPLIRNRIATNYTLKNFSLGLGDYRSRHILLYGFFGGIGYDIFVN